jgi:peptidyl-prolyl cis-trans isomerase B (cyclophilin B)
MRLALAIVSCVSLSPLCAAGTAEIRWSAAQKVLIEDRPFPVQVTIEAPKNGASLPAWALEPAAFTIDGKPLAARRANQQIELAGGQKLSTELDLAPHLFSSKAFEKHKFKLGFAPDGSSGSDVAVEYMIPAGKDVEFLKLPQEELGRWRVWMTTNRGNMEFELWPDVAPNHVRNFLDLCSKGFYDGTSFFRVSPGFMIQGGDPETKHENQALWGTGQGPRLLKAEFNAKKHERGVLSAARNAGDNDSASCQFFVVHGDSPSLDGKYTAFGRMLEGFETLDAIANAKGSQISDKEFRPKEPQKVLSTVVVAPPAPAGKGGGKGSN